MKALQKFIKNPAAVALAVVLAIIALFTGACEDRPNEQEGDKEPEKGEFRVTVNPPSVTLDASHRSETVTVTGVCRGKDVPTPCAGVNWAVKNVFGLPGIVTAEFVGDRKSYQIALKISVDWDKVISGQSGSSLSPGLHEGDVVFNPNLEGADLFAHALIPRGKWGVHVALIVPNEANRQEQTPEKSTLMVPLRRDFSIRKDGGALISSLYVKYSGPPNVLKVSAPVITAGQGSGKFTVLTGDGMPLPGDGSPVAPISIRFEADLTDFNSYNATINVSANNAGTKTVLLSGSRSRF